MTNWPFNQHARSMRIERAEGVYLTTADGQQILDAAGGAIVVNVGHGRKRVADRVAEATEHCTYVVPPWLTPARERLVDALERDWLPANLRRIHITSGGSEAVEAAIKIALQYQAAIGQPEIQKIITRDVS